VIKRWALVALSFPDFSSLLLFFSLLPSIIPPYNPQVVFVRVGIDFTTEEKIHFFRAAEIL